jgi:hypothetical protein
MPNHRRDSLGRFVVGNPSYLKGKKHRASTIRIMSEQKLGQGNPMFGKPSWNRGIPPPEFTIEKQRASILEWNKQNPGTQAGLKHPGWKGGLLIVSGYRKIWIPEHPFADCRGYVFEHRLIAERALGRPLDPKTEDVHHINGDRRDNRNCNLLICSKSYHRQLHARMGKLYQRERFGQPTDLPGNTPPEAVKDGR